MNDDNLIVFFSWGRKDLTEAGFKSLLESKREQDRLLVIDQECLNKEFDPRAKIIPKMKREIRTSNRENPRKFCLDGGKYFFRDLCFIFCPLVDAEIHRIKHRFGCKRCA